MPSVAHGAARGFKLLPKALPPPDALKEMKAIFLKRLRMPEIRTKLRKVQGRPTDR
jgi:hypothetical protein